MTEPHCKTGFTKSIFCNDANDRTAAVSLQHRVPFDKEFYRIGEPYHM